MEELLKKIDERIDEINGFIKKINRTGKDLKSVSKFYEEYGMPPKGMFSITQLYFFHDNLANLCRNLESYSNSVIYPTTTSQTIDFNELSSLVESLDFEIVKFGAMIVSHNLYYGGFGNNGY